jgi:hypothetical protein
VDERSRSNSATLGLTFVSPRVRRLCGKSGDSGVVHATIWHLGGRLGGTLLAFLWGRGRYGDGVDRCGDVMSGQVVPQRPEQPREPQEGRKRGL